MKRWIVVVCVAMCGSLACAQAPDSEVPEGWHFALAPEVNRPPTDEELWVAFVIETLDKSQPALEGGSSGDFEIALLLEIAKHSSKTITEAFEVFRQRFSPDEWPQHEYVQYLIHQLRVDYLGSAYKGEYNGLMRPIDDANGILSFVGTYSLNWPNAIVGMMTNRPLFTNFSGITFHDDAVARRGLRDLEPFKNQRLSKEQTLKLMNTFSESEKMRIALLAKQLPAPKIEVWSDSNEELVNWTIYLLDEMLSREPGEQYGSEGRYEIALLLEVARCPVDALYKSADRYLELGYDYAAEDVLRLVSDVKTGVPGNRMFPLGFKDGLLGFGQDWPGFRSGPWSNPFDRYEGNRSRFDYDLEEYGLRDLSFYENQRLTDEQRSVLWKRFQTLKEKGLVDPLTINSAIENLDENQKADWAAFLMRTVAKTESAVHGDGNGSYLMSIVQDLAAMPSDILCKASQSFLRDPPSTGFLSPNAVLTLVNKLKVDFPEGESLRPLEIRDNWPWFKSLRFSEVNDLCGSNPFDRSKGKSQHQRDLREYGTRDLAPFANRRIGPRERAVLWRKFVASRSGSADETGD